MRICITVGNALVSPPTVQCSHTPNSVLSTKVLRIWGKCMEGVHAYRLGKGREIVCRCKFSRNSNLLITQDFHSLGSHQGSVHNTHCCSVDGNSSDRYAANASPNCFLPLLANNTQPINYALSGYSQVVISQLSIMSGFLQNSCAQLWATLCFSKASSLPQCVGMLVH